MFNGGTVAWATPGGMATDLTILASTLLTLAGLLFLVYVAAVVTGVLCGIAAGPTEAGRARAGRARAARRDGGRR